MNRATAGWNAAATAVLLGALLAGTGCEGPTDEDNSGAEAYFRANQYSSAPRETPSPSVLQIAPTEAAAVNVGQVLVFTVSGGYGGYHWSLSNPDNGEIRARDANQAAYTCVRVGHNEVIVQDDEGHYAVARITPETEAMSVAPSSVTLSGGALHVSFAVSGGVPPYSWVAGNPGLGTVSYSAGSSHVAAYTAVNGAYGQNVISAVDAEGRTASATVIQEP